MIEIFNEIHSENTMIVLIALFRNIKDEDGKEVEMTDSNYTNFLKTEG